MHLISTVFFYFSSTFFFSIFLHGEREREEREEKERRERGERGKKIEKKSRPKVEKTVEIRCIIIQISKVCGFPSETSFKIVSIRNIVQQERV